MTYNVFGGTLNLTLSSYLRVRLSGQKPQREKYGGFPFPLGWARNF